MPAFGTQRCSAAVQQQVGYRGIADLASPMPGRFMGSRSRPLRVEPGKYGAVFISFPEMARHPSVGTFGVGSIQPYKPDLHPFPFDHSATLPVPGKRMLQEMV